MGASAAFRPLAGLTVTELGDGIAGAAAADVLASLGADVTTVVDGGAVLRSLAPVVDGHSTLAAVLDSRKRVVRAADPADVRRLIDGADVVVCDRLHRPAPGLPAAAADYLDAVAAAGRAVWVTVSAFGVSGPRGDRVASDLTVAAAAGLLCIVVDPENSRPQKLPGSQALLSTGAAAALAACHALSEFRVTGEAQHADVSAQAAALLSGPLLQCAAPLYDSGDVGGSGRFGAPSGLFPCRTGAIQITAMEDHQWAALVRTLGSPEWTHEFDRRETRLERAAECNAAITEELAAWDSLLLETKFQEEGVPACAVRGPAELLAAPQFTERDGLRLIDVGGRPARVADGSPRVTEAGDGHPPARVATLRGLRVLEAGHVLAVPLAAALLGACGADVVKLEDPRRPDSYRTRPPYIDRHEHTDWCAYYALANHSKRSLEVDMARREVVAALLDATDVFIENYGPNRAHRYGIDSAQAVRDNPDLLAISSSGFGHSGPFAAYRAYAYNLHAWAGLVDLTRGQGGQPVHVDIAVADLLTAYVLATYVAAWAVGPGRRAGVGLDFAMCESLAARFNDLLAAIDLGVDAVPPPGSNRQAPYAPSGVYRTADDRWLALSVATDADWAACVDALGSPPPLADDRWRTAGSRASDADELDDLLAAAVAGVDASPLADALADRGVAAGVAWSPVEVVEGALDAAHLPRVEHPLWGRRNTIGLPWQLNGHATTELRPSPCLGDARSAVGSWAEQLARLVDAAEIEPGETDAGSRRPTANRKHETTLRRTP